MLRAFLMSGVVLFLAIAAAEGAGDSLVIRGKAVDPRGQPVVNATVCVGVTRSPVKTDAVGAFAITPQRIEDQVRLTILSEDKRLGGFVRIEPGATGAIVRLVPTMSYEGRVLSNEDQPASGLSFRIGINFGHSLDMDQECKADADGHFTARNLIPGAPYSAYWSTDSDSNRDYDQGMTSIDLSKVKAGELITFRARQYLNTLIGKVLNEQSQPIGGAKVAIARSVLQTAEARSQRQPIVADETGEFIIRRLAPGSLKLTVSADGYRPATVYASTESIDLKVVLRRTNTPVCCQVRVMDEKEQAIAGAKVVLQQKLYSYDGRNETVTNSEFVCDNSGRVAVELPSRPADRGQNLLLYCNLEGRVLAVYGLSGREDEEVRLQASRIKEHWLGQVVDSAGHPIAEAVVQVNGYPEYDTPEAMEARYLGPGFFGESTIRLLGLRQRSDAQGRFEFPRLGKALIDISITAAGYAPLNGQFSPYRDMETRPKIFTLQAPASIKGRVVMKATGQGLAAKAQGMVSFYELRGGAPVAQVGVSPDWTFSCDTLPIGRYRVEVRLYGEELKAFSGPKPSEVEVIPGKATEMTIELEQ